MTPERNNAPDPSKSPVYALWRVIALIWKNPEIQFEDYKLAVSSSASSAGYDQHSGHTRRIAWLYQRGINHPKSINGTQCSWASIQTTVSLTSDQQTNQFKR